MAIPLLNKRCNLMYHPFLRQKKMQESLISLQQKVPLKKVIETDRLWQANSLTALFLMSHPSFFFFSGYLTTKKMFLHRRSLNTSEDFNQVITSKTCNNNPGMCFSQIGVIKDSSGEVSFALLPSKAV